MNVLTGFFEPVLGHNILYASISNTRVGRPIHQNSWQAVYAHYNAHTKEGIKFLSSDIFPLVKPCFFHWFTNFFCAYWLVSRTTKWMMERSTILLKNFLFASLGTATSIPEVVVRLSITRSSKSCDHRVSSLHLLQLSSSELPSL